MSLKTKTIKPVSPLPTGIIATDLLPPKCKTKAQWNALWSLGGDRRELQLWHTTSLGWCIPTLLISGAGRRRATTDRTYAIRVSNGTVCRIGKGPHVTQILTVYNTPKRSKALQPFFDLKTSGAADAGVIRDRISSRRAEGQLRRQNGESSWRWSL